MANNPISRSTCWNYVRLAGISCGGRTTHFKIILIIIIINCWWGQGCAFIRCRRELPYIYVKRMMAAGAAAAAMATAQEDDQVLRTYWFMYFERNLLFIVSLRFPSLPFPSRLFPFHWTHSSMSRNIFMYGRVYVEAKHVLLLATGLWWLTL